MKIDLEAQKLLYLNQILAELHENEDQQAAFNVFLNKLKDLVICEKGDIYFYKKNGGKIEFEDFIFIDWEEDNLSNYINNYCEIDDVLPLIQSNQPIMFRDVDVFIQDERQKTRYYNELLDPAGMNHSIEGNLYMDDEGNVGGIGIHRPKKYDEFNETDLAILRIARPHLASVAKKYHNSQLQLENYLREMPLLSYISGLGICIWDSNLRIIDCNFQENDLVDDKHIPQLMRALTTLCKNIIETMAEGGPKEKKISMRSRINIGEIKYFAEVVCTDKLGEGQFVATVYDYASLFGGALREIKNKYNLTDREYDILKCIIRGKNNIEISKELFISVPTVKKHTGSIYKKMNIDGRHQILNEVL